MKKAIFVGLFSCSLFFPSAFARDNITTVGSSTVYPFATVASENFGRAHGSTPIIESTGTGGGFKLFCKGTGVKTPDISNASRAIQSKEVENCKSNGVTPVEVKIGYDGIVIANDKSGFAFELTLRELYLALAKKVPHGKQMMDNPYMMWSDINPKLPNKKIEVLGPPPTSGTRDAFLELVMEKGAKTFPELKTLRKKDKKAFKKLTHTIREDGIYIEVGENDNLIVQKLRANPDAIGIFGYSFLDQNTDTIKGAKIEGVEPTFENIAGGQYKVSRPLFFYVKKEHVGVIPKLKEYVMFFVSDRMIGDEGATVDKGLIPLDEDARQVLRKKVEVELGGS